MKGNSEAAYFSKRPAVLLYTLIIKANIGAALQKSALDVYCTARAARYFPTVGTL